MLDSIGLCYVCGYKATAKSPAITNSFLSLYCIAHELQDQEGPDQKCVILCRSDPSYTPWICAFFAELRKRQCTTGIRNRNYDINVFFAEERTK